MTTAYIGLGSNLDDPQAQIERALDAIANSPDIALKKRSRLFRTAPWGLSSQPDFVNAAVMVETSLSSQDILKRLLDIERDFGRVRDGSRWGPRVLDLDLLMVGVQTLDEPGLHLPHPHLHERAFVLLPLADIAPDLVVPGHGDVRSLLAKVDKRGCEPIETA